MVYLCGRSGRYVTGITLPVDAGYTRQVVGSLARLVSTLSGIMA